MSCELKVLPKTKKYHAYICKSENRNDTSVVSKIEDICRQNGLILYSHENDFNPHLTILKNREQAMRQSVKIVFVLSSHYLSSKIGALETDLAVTIFLNDRNCSSVIPVLIEECEIPTHMIPLRFIDARNDKNDWLSNLMIAIQRIEHLEQTLMLPEGKQYHVFFIYRTVSPDKDWVKQVAESLEASEMGFKCAFHERDFVPGQSIFDNIVYFLKCSLKIVIVLTPEFLKSAWTKYETELAQILSINHDDIRIIPVVVQNCDIPDILKTLTYLDATDVFSTWWPRLLKTINIPNDQLILQPRRFESAIQTLRLCHFCGKHDSDGYKSWLIDIKFTKYEYILVTDAKNKKMKKFDFKGKLQKDKLFESRPMFFTYFDNDTSYVTFPDEPVLRIIDCSNFGVVKEVCVPTHCSGIEKINEQKFALAIREECVIVVMTTSGERIQTIKPMIGVYEESFNLLTFTGYDEGNDSEEEIVSAKHNADAGHKDFGALKRQRLSLQESNSRNRLVWPGFLCASDSHICVTDYQTSMLTIISMKENGEFTHKSIPLVDPRGVTIHDNRLFVAAGTIRILTMEGEHDSDIIIHGDPITFPRSIAFDRRGHYMAVSHKGDKDDCISVFQLLSI